MKNRIKIELIKAKLNDKNLLLKDVAKFIGISYVALKKKMYAEREFKALELKKIADLIGCYVDELFE